MKQTLILLQSFFESQYLSHRKPCKKHCKKLSMWKIKPPVCGLTLTPAFTKLLGFLSVLFLLITVKPVLGTKDRITIVGSSTVFPFSTTVAERFGRSDFKTPVVESIGTGGGFKTACHDHSEEIRIVNASRRVTLPELEKCLENNIHLV